jgi:hypothetical protein
MSYKYAKRLLGHYLAFQQNLGRTLLNDKSYQTQEIALYNLWNNFPEYRIRYLDQSKIGLGTMIIISEHYGYWLYPLKVIQQIKAL